MSTETDSRNETIRELRSQKLNLIPIPPKQKFPIGEWKKFMTERNESPIPDTMDYAVICGDVSDKLVVVDIDHKGEYPVIVEKILKNAFNKTLVVKTGSGGHHIYIKCHNLPNSVKLRNEKLKVNGDHGQQSMGLDVQSNGRLVVGPDSTHKSGNSYEIVSSTKTIKVMDFQTILINLEQLGFEGTIQKGMVKDIANNVSEVGSRHENGIKYGNLIYGSLRDKETFKFEMERWNQQACNPPLPKAELERMLSDIIQYQDKKHAKEQAGNVEAMEEKEDTVDGIVDRIIGEHRILTTKDNEQMFHFDGKVWNPTDAEATIKLLCEQEKKGCTNRFVSEVIGKLKRLTFTSHSNPVFNGQRDEFDSDLSRVTLDNGVLDTATMNVEEHSPNNLSTVLLPVSWTPDKNQVILGDKDITVDEIDQLLKGTMFYNYIQQCFTDEKGEILIPPMYTVLEMMASCIFKTNKFHKAFMMIGSGANGKSVCLNFLTAMLGARNVSDVPIQSLAHERFATAELYGKLANIYADIESTELKQTGKLKVLISQDKVYAERKNRDPFYFDNYAKLIFSANKFPQVSDQSDGFFRRFIIINWQRQFSPKERDAELSDKLRDPKELNAVFKCLVVMGKRLTQRGSFLYESTINDMRKDWLKSADPVQMFIDEMVIEDTFENASIMTKQEVYKAYLEWCTYKEMTPVKPKQLSQHMGEYFEEATRKIDDKGTARVWVGIQIKPLHTNSTLRDFE